MADKKISSSSVAKLTIGGILTGIVVVLQLLGSFIHFGPFSVSLVLVPIIIGAATSGTLLSTWLGLVFGIAVLLSGDAAAFLSISIPGTIITVLLKGALCGTFAGLVYKALRKVNTYLAVAVAAVVAPVTNTGIFLLGCKVFFFDTVSEWAKANDFASTATFMIVGLVGFNFLFELGTNVVLCPAIVRIINAVTNRKKKTDAPEVTDASSIEI